MNDRRLMISREDDLSIRCQCELTGVSRGSFYYVPVGETHENLKIMRLMDKHYLEYPTEGVLRMHDFLLTLGIVANHKRVRRLLRLMGLMAIYPRRNLSRSGQAKYIKPYLLRGLKIARPNQVWAIDNIFIERFRRSVKYDYVYIKVPFDGVELYKGFKEYMDYIITGFVIRA